MTNLLKLTIEIEETEEGGFNASVKEHKGAVSHGDTIHQAIGNTLDVLESLLVGALEASLPQRKYMLLRAIRKG